MRMFPRYLRPYLGSRRAYNSLLLLVVCSLLGGLMLSQWLDRAGDVMMAGTLHKDLLHLRGSRSLHDYIDALPDPLVEPSSVSCELESVPILVLVSSAPGRQERRHAIRDSWAKELPTYFFLGMRPPDYNGMLVDNYVEAKQHRDLVVYDFVDAYHNLTLKSALMLQWAQRRCPRAEFVLKTDDDVFVNPWTLRRLVQDRADAQLIGYKITGATPHRNPYNKWFLPRWLYPHDTIPEYLSGTGYLIKGEYVPKIFEAAFEVPLINLEDIFFTYLVAHRALGLHLTHEDRLSPHKPMVPFQCAYWHFASIHSLEPSSISAVWTQIEELGREFDNGDAVCDTYDKYFNLFSSNALLY